MLGNFLLYFVSYVPYFDKRETERRTRRLIFTNLLEEIYKIVAPCERPGLGEARNVLKVLRYVKC